MPTANIASLQFNPAKDNDVSADDDPIVTAINKINETIARLNEINERNTDKVIAAVNGIQIGPPVEIPDKIKLDLPEVVTAVGKIVATFEALKPYPNPALEALNVTIEEFNSYLRGNTAIADLNAMIVGLNATIKVLNISGAGNRCLPGWKKLRTIQPLQVGDTRENFDTHTLQQLLLIGRIDTEQFSQVWESLKKESGREIDPKRIILLSSDPPHIGVDQFDTDQYLYFEYDPSLYDPPRVSSDAPKDWSVEVYACWTPKPEQINSSTDSAD